MKRAFAILCLLMLSASPVLALEAVQKFDIEMNSYAFEPDLITVKKGIPVELHFKNTSFMTPHDFVIDAPASELKIKVNVHPNGSGTVTFTPQKTGDFRFYCSKKMVFMKSHDDKGMHGTLRVTE